MRDLVTHRGDIHHLFPSNYLKKSGLQKWKYNQIANFAYMQSEINIKIGDVAPKVYFGHLLAQCENGTDAKYGGITSLAALKYNLEENCIPESIFEMVDADYEDFLTARRKLMARKIRDYYFAL